MLFKIVPLGAIATLAMSKFDYYGELMAQFYWKNLSKYFKP